jgi:hypothetical protein
LPFFFLACLDRNKEMMKKAFLLTVLLMGLVVAAMGESRVHHRHHDEEESDEAETETEASSEGEESESFVESNAQQQQDADLVQSLYKLVKSVCTHCTTYLSDQLLIVLCAVLCVGRPALNNGGDCDVYH